LYAEAHAARRSVFHHGYVALHCLVFAWYGNFNARKMRFSNGCAALIFRGRLACFKRRGLYARVVGRGLLELNTNKVSNPIIVSTMANRAPELLTAEADFNGRTNRERDADAEAHAADRSVLEHRDISNGCVASQS
jgi:hypothetical protein